MPLRTVASDRGASAWLGIVGSLLCAAHAAGCNAANSLPDAAQDVDIVRPGVIRCLNDTCPEDQIFRVPESISAGEPFAVTITTFGAGCESADSMDVLVEDDRAELRPFDRTFIPAGYGCTTELKLIEHTDTLVFATSGAKTLVVFGRWVTPQLDMPTQKELVIDVQ